LRKKITSLEQEYAHHRYESRASIDMTPSKMLITENDESRQFSELKGCDPSKYKIPKSMNFEQLFNDLINMDHRQLVDY
jgi:hypothetical protein